MGGLAKGELASATVISAFENWFVKELPITIQNGYEPAIIKNRWKSIIIEKNEAIAAYGRSINVHLGTTLTAMLIVNDRYIAVNVGDTRAYELSNELKQITKDQTVVAREIERGNLTPEEAEQDSRRNVLLQCIGASRIVVPDYFEGKVKEGNAYLLCSDGFRHEISEEEISAELYPALLNSEEEIKK